MWCTWNIFQLLKSNVWNNNNNRGKIKRTESISAGDSSVRSGGSAQTFSKKLDRDCLPFAGCTSICVRALWGWLCVCPSCQYQEIERSWRRKEDAGNYSRGSFHGAIDSWRHINKMWDSNERRMRWGGQGKRSPALEWRFLHVLCRSVLSSPRKPPNLLPTIQRQTFSILNVDIVIPKGSVSYAVYLVLCFHVLFITNE